MTVLRWRRGQRGWGSAALSGAVTARTTRPQSLVGHVMIPPEQALASVTV